MKKNLVLSLVMLAMIGIMITAGIVHAEQVQVGISDASGEYESMVEVPITITGADDVGSLDMVITYDPDLLQVDSVSKGELNEGIISSNTNTEGILSIGIVDQNGINDDGEIAVISFTVINTTGSSPVIVESLDVYDVDGLEIDASAQSGTFTVSKLSSDPKAESPGFELMVLLLGIICIILIFRGRKK